MSVMCNVFFLFFTASFGCAQSQATDDFLRKAQLSHEKLVGELEDVVGFNTISARLDRLRNRLRPMFVSLPKRQGELLSPATTRYALHRFHVHWHGWSISETDLTEDNPNMSAIWSGVSNDLLPGRVRRIFARHLGPDGVSLDDLAVLASAVEYHVHTDQKMMLRKVGEIYGLPTVGPIPEVDMKNIVRVYMISFLQKVDLKDMRKYKSMKRLLNKTTEGYPGWKDLARLVHDEGESLFYNERQQANPFKPRESSMDMALRLVEQLADNFARRHAELECQEIKEDLLEREHANTGRVKLADFYRAGLDARFFYVESEPYLRAIGALDETDTISGPRVIVPNYVQAKSNCLASGHIYSVCCMNECESLYGHIEKSIAAPESSTDRIIALVGALSSSTVQGPRNLSQTLHSKLGEIANGQGGRIILHSRLFAQWMHQAFPRECPYPHLPGTVTDIHPSAWTKKTGQASRIDYGKGGNRLNQLLHHIMKIENRTEDKKYANGDSSGNSVASNADEAFMWTTDDAHFVEPKPPLISPACIPMVGALFAMLTFTVKTVRPSWEAYNAPYAKQNLRPVNV